MQYFLLFLFASCVIQSFAIGVLTSSSSTKPENRDFEVLFPNTTEKRSPAVYKFTCSYCVAVRVDVAVLASQKLPSRSSRGEGELRFAD